MVHSAPKHNDRALCMYICTCSLIDTVNRARARRSNSKSCFSRRHDMTRETCGSGHGGQPHGTPTRRMHQRHRVGATLTRFRTAPPQRTAPARSRPNTTVPGGERQESAGRCGGTLLPTRNAISTKLTFFPSVARPLSVSSSLSLATVIAFAFWGVSVILLVGGSPKKARRDGQTVEQEKAGTPGLARPATQGSRSRKKTLRGS